MVAERVVTVRTNQNNLLVIEGWGIARAALVISALVWDKAETYSIAFKLKMDLQIWRKVPPAIVSFDEEFGWIFADNPANCVRKIVKL